MRYRYATQQPDADAIVHVAAKAGPGLYAPDFESANVTGTQNVLAACRELGYLEFWFTPPRPAWSMAVAISRTATNPCLIRPAFTRLTRKPRPAAERLVLAANGPETENLRTAGRT